MHAGLLMSYYYKENFEEKKKLKCPLRKITEKIGSDQLFASPLAQNQERQG